MGLHSVVMVTHRRQMQSTLARLLGADPSGCCRRLPLSEALHLPRPTSVVVDVLELFPQPAALDPEFIPRTLPNIVVLALREDFDANLSAANKGIPFDILEDLTPSGISRLLGQSGPSRHLYQALGYLAARRVRAYRLRQASRPKLTRRESQVVELAGNGHNNSEIATLLGIEPKTVKNCLTRAYRRLGVTGRQEAAALVSAAQAAAPLESRPRLARTS